MSEPIEAVKVSSEPVANMTANQATKSEDTSTVTQDNSKIEQLFQKASKQDNHLRAERQKLEQAKKEQESVAKEAEEYRNLKALRDKDPIEALKALGYDVGALAKHLGAKSSGDSTVDALLQKVQALEAKVVETESKAEQNKIAQAEKHLNSQIAKHTSQKEYAIIEKVGASHAVRQFMETVYDKTGEVPSVKDACEAVKSHIAETYAKVANDETILAKTGKKTNEPEFKDTTYKKPVVTLMNKMTQSETGSPAPSTDAERVAAAIALVNKMSSEGVGKKTGRFKR